jgi:hypothetical protein
VETPTIAKSVEVTSVRTTPPTSAAIMPSPGLALYFNTSGGGGSAGTTQGRKAWGAVAAPMLHVVNGDAFLPRLREGDVAGPALAWADMLSEGPLVNRLQTEADWRTRAAGIDPFYRVDPTAYVEAAMGRLAEIRAAADAGTEIVFWFDEELFCQANLCYLLDWLARESPKANASLVLDPDPLGASPVGGLRTLFADREPLTPERLALARRFWAAISGPDPTDLGAILAGDLSAWPLLEQGARAHLARFPSKGRGLSEVEEELLRLAKRGPTPFAELFTAWQQMPLGRASGFGDAQVALALLRLAPLVDVEPRGAHVEDVPRWSVTVTSTGKEALAGRAHEVRPSRGWIGGARADAWRRDGDRLVRA